MRTRVAALLIAAGALAGCNDLPNRGRYPPPAVSTAESSREAISRALADPARPAADRAQDATRRAADTLAFTRVAPGQRVVELMPSGYYTRLFARAVGERGRVIALWPAGAPEPYVTALRPITDDDGVYPNVDLLQQPPPGLTLEAPADLVVAALTYHDLHAFDLNAAAYNRAIFAALRPGGLYVVIDHAAPDGAELSTVDALRRIDEAAVRREVEAVGFVFDGRGEFLRNPADPRTARSSDPSIRGRTDQFALRFRKPMS